MSKQSTKNKIIRDLEITAIFTSIVGLLSRVAKKTGESSKKYSKEQVTESTEEFGKKLTLILSELDELISYATEEGKELIGHRREYFDDALKQANETKTKLDSLLSAIKEGNAEDKDLDLAVKEAKKAAVHIKKFLLKQ